MTTARRIVDLMREGRHVEADALATTLEDDNNAVTWAIATMRVIDPSAPLENVIRVAREAQRLDGRERTTERG